MAEVTHLAWYRQGLVSLTKGSTKVTGSGTKFLTAGINQGAALRLDERPYAWEIRAVISDTELELAIPYSGETVSNAAYSIDRNHQSTLPATLSARLARAMGNWEGRYDLDMQRITGPSAYDLAVKNGYVGTEAQWLEYLRNGGEFTALKADINTKYNTLDERTKLLTQKNSAINNSWCLYGQFFDMNTAYEKGIMTYLHPGMWWDWNLGEFGVTRNFVLGVNCEADTGAFGYKQNVTVLIRPLYGNSKMNLPLYESDDLTGGFLDSLAWKEYFPAIQEKIEALLPSADKLLGCTYDFSDAADANGTVTHRVSTYSKLALPCLKNFTPRITPDTNSMVHTVYTSVLYPLAFYFPLFLNECWWNSSTTYNGKWRRFMAYGGGYPVTDPFPLCMIARLAA